MKRLSTALAPTLMASALLGIGAASQAQTSLITLEGNIPNFVRRGDVFTVEVFATPLATAQFTTTFQTVVFANRPGNMQPHWTQDQALESSVLTHSTTNSPKTLTIASGEYAGTHTVFSSGVGFQQGTSLAAHTHVGSYTFTVPTDAPGGFVDFGLIQGSVAGNGLITSPNFSTTFRSLMTTSGPNTSATALEGGNFPGRTGAFRVGIVPGPSSLAVFALGGFAPAMALLRRRRAAK